MMRALVVVFVLLASQLAHAAGVDRIWNCSYRDCSKLVAQSGDSLDTQLADTVLLGSSAGEVRVFDTLSLLDSDRTENNIFAMMEWDKTITLNGLLAFPTVLGAKGKFHFDVGPYLGNPPKLFVFQSDVELDSGATSKLSGVSPFYSQPTIKTVAGSVWNLEASDNSLAAFMETSIFDGAFSTTSGYDQFRAKGQLISGTTIDELTAFRCSPPVNAGTLNTRRCFVVDAQTGSTAAVGIENNSTTVLPPGTALDPSSSISPVRTLIELDPTANRDMATPAIVDGVDGQVVTFVNTDPAYWVTFWDGRNIRVSDQQCKGMCTSYLGLDYCRLLQWDSISFAYLDSLGEWVMTACADNN